VNAKTAIAHRGASAYAPEHTLAAYRLALAMKADFVEQDLQMTRDGALVCLHDTTLERTTDVQKVFPDRARRSQAGGRAVESWPVVDFTLDELRRLDAGSWFDARFAGERIPTFEEAIALVAGQAGVYPELKEPGYYEQFGLNMASAVAAVLAAHGLDRPEGQAATPVFIQSFSPEALKEMRRLTGRTYRLIQLVGGGQAATLLSDAGLDEVAAYADGIGPAVGLLLRDRSRLEAARRRGLLVHPYTVNVASLPDLYPDVRSYTDFLLYELGVDGVFTDHPDQFPRY